VAGRDQKIGYQSSKTLVCYFIISN